MHGSVLLRLFSIYYDSEYAARYPRYQLNGVSENESFHSGVKESSPPDFLVGLPATHTHSCRQRRYWCGRPSSRPRASLECDVHNISIIHILHYGCLKYEVFQAWSIRGVPDECGFRTVLHCCLHKRDCEFRPDDTILGRLDAWRASKF